VRLGELVPVLRMGWRLQKTHSVDGSHLPDGWFAPDAKKPMKELRAARIDIFVKLEAQCNYVVAQRDAEAGW